MEKDTDATVLQIARRIEEIRTLRGISQWELAQRAQYQRTWVSRTEGAGVSFSLDTLDRYAAALDVDPLSLVTSGALLPRKAEDKSTLRERLAINVIRLRDAQNLSQESLSINARLGRHFVSQVERENTRSSIPNLQKLADALGVPLSELFKQVDAASVNLKNSRRTRSKRIRKLDVKAAQPDE
ncbi:transcriptional regulator [Pandoraea terrae]|uniref:Transcriptional regulator n=1 Tax=Pandoraea terrae TaxID=1537710 RepID=A0A5E4XC69_9BURK|nr:helix-turn-helix transcriptional regulator [Pandoraea terrae]VVE33944.1 transcriptional regulator [Pandoraea terrae]